MKFRLAIALLFFAAPAFAAPAAWQAVPAASRIGFTAYWQGQPVKGKFPVFQLTAELDPAHPAGGTIKLDIATARLTTDSSDITRAIRGKAWFDVKDYPQANFTSASITTETGGALQLRGKLRIKGHEKAVGLPLKVTRSSDRLELSGKLALDRSDFAIGTGQWASGKMIAHKVDVAFSIVLARAR